MELKIKNKAKEELAKLEAIRIKKVVRMKKTIAEQIKKDGEQQRVARARDPQKKSASKSLSRKRVDAKKEEKDSLLAPKDLPQSESSKHALDPPKMIEQPQITKTKAKFKDFSQFEKLDKNVI